MWLHSQVLMLAVIGSILCAVGLTRTFCLIHTLAIASMSTPMFLFDYSTLICVQAVRRIMLKNHTLKTSAQQALIAQHYTEVVEECTIAS